MKALVTFFTIISLAFGKTDQEVFTMKAVFDGFEDDTYFFTDSEDETYYIQEVTAEVTKTYDLKDIKYNGKTFNVTYETQKRIDENNEPYEVFVITKLTLVE